MRLGCWWMLCLLASVGAFPTPLAQSEQETSPVATWHSWLLRDDADPEPRRIRPKSVFIAPTINHQPIKCPEDYIPDAMGRRCVKLVRVDHNTQLEFLLQRLNAAYNRGGLVSNNPGSPLKLPIPIANASPPMVTSTSTTTTTTSTTTTMPTTAAATSKEKEKTLNEAVRYAIVAEPPTPSLIDEQLIVVKQQTTTTTTNTPNKEEEEETTTTTTTREMETTTVLPTSTTMDMIETTEFNQMKLKRADGDEGKRKLTKKEEEEEEVFSSGDGDPLPGWIRFPDDDSNAVRFPNENSFVFPRELTPDILRLEFGSVDQTRHRPVINRFWEKLPDYSYKNPPPFYRQQPRQHPPWHHPRLF